MRAICGIHFLDSRPVESELLIKMVEQSAPWRGDDSGVWLDGAIGLGQKYTFDGPESIKWTHPLVHEDLVVTADARIDNREELISALDLGKRPAQDISDHLLIACAYKKWGKSCPIRLIGEYSFAIWDKSARELFCARDAMGVKPFYYYLAKGAIIFGSTIRSLLSVPFVPRELSEIRMVNHLVYNADDKESTFYKDIFRLPGGHCLSVSSAGSRKWQFWDLDADRELDLRSDDEYAEAFRELFTEAVNCRLRGAKPVGTFLSGGMDSSSLTCVARDLLKKSDRGPLHSFSSVFPKMAEKDRRIDESHYQKLVVDAGGIVHHPVITDAINPLHEHLWNGDEPSSLFNTYLLQTILAQARKSDVQVMLDGIDGDSTISHGTRYITELARRGRWFKMLNESRALAKNLHIPLFKVLWVMGLYPWVPDFVKNVVGVVRRRPRQNFSRLNLLSPDLVARSHAHEEMDKYLELRQVKAWSFRIEHKFSIMQGLWAQSLDLLRRLEDYSTIEIRHPFFDRRLLEFCLAIPAGQKMKNGVTRYILHRAMDGIIPEEINKRIDKGNISSNFLKYFAIHGKERINEILSARSGGVSELLNIRKVMELYSKFEQDPLKCEQEAIFLFPMLTLDQWLRGLPR